MNWTASLLRSELSKQKSFYEQRINLLTQASIDVQNFLELEEKVKELEANLKTSKQSIKQIENELKNQAELSSKQLESKELFIKELEQKIKEYKDKIFNLNKQIRELNLYHQQSLRQNQENHQAKLTPLQKQVNELKQSLLSLAQKKLKGKEEQQKLLTELQTQWDKEKEQISKEYLAKISEINQQTTNLSQLAQQLQKNSKKQEKQLEKLTNKQTKTQQILTDGQLIFNQIEKIINKDTTIVLASKKKIRSKVEEFKHLLGWGATEIEESEEEIISSPEISPTETFLISEPVKEKESSKKTKKALNWKDYGVPFLDFTEELTQQWIAQDFTKLQCQAWLNIGFSAQKAEFARWLEKEAHFTPLDYLNETSPEEQAELIKQFNEYKKN